MKTLKEIWQYIVRVWNSKPKEGDNPLINILLRIAIGIGLMTAFPLLILGLIFLSPLILIRLATVLLNKVTTKI